jgi:hypothetical protein
MLSLEMGSQHMARTKVGTQADRRLGRPPGNPESIRHKRVVTLMTDAEFKKLAKIADENERSVSALVHQIVLRYLKRRN